MSKKLARRLAKYVCDDRFSLLKTVKIMRRVNAFTLRGFSNSGKYLRMMQLQTFVDAFKDSSKSVWTSVLFPAEILHPFGRWAVSLEVVSGLFSTLGMSPHFLRLAEGIGVPATMCSFHRMLIGLSESGVVYRPDFVAAASTLCDGNIKSFAAVAEKQEVPFLFLDVPYEESEDAVDYLTGQLEDVVQKISETTGISPPNNVWREQARSVNRSLSLLRRFFKVQKTSFKNLYRAYEIANEAFTFHYLLGHERLEGILDRMCRDVECGTKIRKGYRHLVLPKKVKRLMWLHIVPQYSTPMWPLIDDGERSRIVCDDYSAPYFDAYDEDNFFRSVARRLITHPSNGPLTRRISHILDVARSFSVDGIVHYSSWGCHQASGNVQLLEEALRSEGFPFVNIAGDAADARNASSEQHLTRLEAFLEQLD